MHPTEEQRAVIEAGTDHHLVVKAFAGAAKTTTLEWRARRHRGKRFLYLAFNKPVKQEAKRRFPTNTVCKTTHSLAFPTAGQRYEHKLGDPKTWEVKKALKSSEGGDLYANLCLEAVKRYIGSADYELGRQHVPVEQAEGLGFDVDRLEIDARTVWHSMAWPRHPLSMPHDGYLKLFQLDPTPLAKRYDHIFLDEGQDTNAAFFSMLRRSEVPISMVGDSYQAIYQFRHAVDAMDQLETDQRLSLTGSFRFGPELALAANTLLSLFLEPQECLEGLGEETKVVTRAEWEAEPKPAPCHLHRTNAGVFESAVEACEKGQGVYWVGGVGKYRLDRLAEIHALAVGDRRGVRDPFLRRFSSVEELKQYAAHASDQEIMAQLRIQERYGAHTRRLADALRQNEVKDPRLADRIVATAHRAKGVEFDHVIMGDDFASLMLKVRDPHTGETAWHPRTMGWIDHEDREQPDAAELYLIYVAMTRARRTLVLNRQLERLFEFAPVLGR